MVTTVLFNVCYRSIRPCNTCIVVVGFNDALRPQKPQGLLGTGSQDDHLDFHTAPGLCSSSDSDRFYIALFSALE